MKKLIIIIGTVIIFGLIAGGVYYFFKKPPEQDIETKTTHPLCLSENEIAIYTIDRQKDVSPVDIIIKDKKNGKEIYKFAIDSVWPISYPVQPRKCNVYVIKQFNFDYKQFKPLPGFRVELWQYKYNGEGMPILTFAEKDEGGQPTIYYNSEFQIDFIEKLIALIRGYVGRTDFATVIKEIETQNDVFSLMYEDIISKYPNFVGSFGLKGWTKDSRYFWGDIAYGANVLGFFRIERNTWKVDILPSPENVLGGDALNLENSYITVHPDNIWFGVAQITEEEKARRRAQGIGTELYIYNLITGERYFIDKTEEPLWYFKPRWISGTELQYELPTGEKKVYKINEK